MHNSKVFLDIYEMGVNMELQLPLGELELAFGHQLNRDRSTIIQRLSPELTTCLLNHITVTSQDGLQWTIQLKQLSVQTLSDENLKSKHELNAILWI